MEFQEFRENNFIKLKGNNQTADVWANAYFNTHTCDMQNNVFPVIFFYNCIKLKGNKLFRITNNNNKILFTL